MGERPAELVLINPTYDYGVAAPFFVSLYIHVHWGSLIGQLVIGQQYKDYWI